MFVFRSGAGGVARIASLACALLGFCELVHAQAQTITLDGSSSGRIFEGIGAVSSGGSSRLLIDYPEPYRGQILDYLFKPNYGASLQSLKVEIGGDEDSGGGAEPSHMRSLTDQNYTRGYEWWLMQQAKLRNPNIKLQALAWGAPGWVGGGVYYSQDTINYIINFILGAKNTYGLTIDYIGTLNESALQRCLDRESQGRASRQRPHHQTGSGRREHGQRLVHRQRPLERQRADVCNRCRRGALSRIH